ncbi:hypothetical protein DPMN_013677 [Dreissena polymorpha]|uniref:Uncharacterized protein n=1 Tax=Dreissena polymorpha TaxID=45954 RepID=A0A9D4S3Z5_DREPO|nr:hypothetical protein DPMN_013677 [Dreissena polymorpha]
MAETTWSLVQGRAAELSHPEPDRLMTKGVTSYYRCRREESLGRRASEWNSKTIANLETTCFDYLNADKKMDR